MKAPIVYVDHGSPMSFLENNRTNQVLSQLGKKFDAEIKGIVCVSAHNISDRTYVSSGKTLKTLHNFYGFPEELYTEIYDIENDEVLSQELLKNIPGALPREHMQVDHGIWMVLKKMFPNNDKKACIITINMQAMSEEYFGIGEKLQAFREKGYMIFCSGNIVHNFDFIDSNSEAIYPWAREFNELIASHILSRNFDTIINYQGLKDYEKAFKTKEHFAPLIFAIGASFPDDQIYYAEQSISHGSLSHDVIVFERGV